jgi:uncharacterized phage-associated protein
VEFVFDIDKTVAAAAYLSKKFAKVGEPVSTFKLIKAMYAAERIALQEWRRPITGDSFFSLKKGPILGRTYSLIKNEVLSTNSDMERWSKCFFPRQGYYLSLKAEPDYDFLSERELEALDRAHGEIEALEKKHGLIADELHKKWPEWKDPSQFGKKSIPLTVEEILAELLEDESEASAVGDEIKAVSSAKASLQVGIA